MENQQENRVPIGEKISPILIELAGAVKDYDDHIRSAPMYTEEGFMAAVSLFSSALLDKMYAKCKRDGMCVDEASDLAVEKLLALRSIIIECTGLEPRLISY